MTLQRLRQRPRRHLLVLLSVLASGLAPASLWYGTHSTQMIDGQYAANGQVVLESGQVLDIVHWTLFRDGRFYTMTRYGRSLLETSGRVERDLIGHLSLLVESGGPTDALQTSGNDDEVMLNLLYSNQRGSRIRMEPLGDCFWAVETRHIFCPQKSRGPFRRANEAL
ncbi:hypothetical protein [Pseudomonas sp. zfem005]|uniref:hypothetical protein n=1 Tax=Pseudomonas sp. zfem005 TaxID=3078200 RepID=UPI002929EB9D|nr:hypothetical protein [Pseudomonas sp. zfem005]MDU9411883.1 hypothetical protein [Pseudomonas sp. zfem005]